LPNKIKTIKDAANANDEVTVTTANYECITGYKKIQFCGKVTGCANNDANFNDLQKLQLCAKDITDCTEWHVETFASDRLGGTDSIPKPEFHYYVAEKCKVCAADLTKIPTTAGNECKSASKTDFGDCTSADYNGDNI